MTNFIKSGRNLTLIAPYNVLSGGGFKVGNIFAVAANDTLATATVECDVVGVYDLAKDASVFAQGDLIYWDDVNKVATSTVGGNLVIGQCEIAAVTGASTVRARLLGVPGFSGQVNGVKVAHMLFDFAVDGGATCTPANSDTIPNNAVVFGGVVNATTAVTAAGAATVAITTSAGSGAGSILGATGKAALGLDAVVAPACEAAPFKMTADGKPSIVVATGPLTAGVIEAWVLYAIASA
jgi:predicted RecA/RadA family phage recombinase